MYKEISKNMLTFLKNSPSAFHAVQNIKEELIANEYVELLEGKEWTISPGGKYFVTRNGSSIIAFQVGTELDEYGFQVVASHSDSPTFKVKENAELEVRGKYTQLNTEGYGGMLCATWLDRPLSVAGRVLVREGNRITGRLLKIDRDLLLIPNVAIHMDRTVNDGYKYNKQIDMLPLFGGADTRKGDFRKLIATELGVDESAMYGCDLYLYNRMEPSIWGANEEFVSAPHLDDLQCAYAALQGFLSGYNSKNINVMVCYDNEEVGSGTKQGAESTFLYDVLHRINTALGKKEEAYYRALANSFMLSADNAHAVHPNHPEKTDASNCVYMNEGIVVKSHAGQKYTSDAVSIAVFRRICEEAGVPVQFFANRSDMAGGSTLGNISSTKVAMNAVDIGLPQLAMHSSYETAGIKDTYYMVKAMEMFYKTTICEVSESAWNIDVPS